MFSMSVIALHSRGALYEDIKKPPSYRSLRSPEHVYALHATVLRCKQTHLLSYVLPIKRDKYTHAVEGPAVFVEVSY